MPFAQADPPPPPPPHFDVHVDLSGLANLIWSSFIDHIGDVGGVIWQGVRDHLSEIATAIWTPLSAWLEAGLRSAAMAIWNATFGAVGNIYGTLPPEWTYNLPAYRTVATDPLPVAIGGATLALVLLGLRTLLGSMVGRDHVITHVTGRLIPAVFMAVAYPVLLVRGVELLNSASAGVGTQAAVAAARNLPQLIFTATDPASILLWAVLIFYGIRLLLRVVYSLVRFTVALVFGPVALILWAIPQTEWVTSFWLRELVGWGTTPLLVAVALSLAVSMAVMQGGSLAGVAFAIAGFQAAYDVVGLLSMAQRGGRGASPIGYIRMAAQAGTGGGVSAGAQAAAMRSYAATERAAATERFYGYD